MLARKTVFTAAFLGLISLAAPLYAQDVFIRPNAGSNTGNAVDYGVKAQPRAPQPAPAQVQQPAPQPMPQAQAPAPAPAQNYQPPQAAAPDYSNTDNQVSIQSPTKDVTVYNLPPDPPPGRGKGPNTLSLAFQGGALGASDRSSVTQSLGITEAEVQSNCFFRYSTMVTYGGGQGDFVQSGSTPRVQYSFTGPLEKISVYPTVACRKLHAPVSGMIIEQGGYYVTSLNSVDCQPPPPERANTPNITFSYLGDGKGQCTYQ